VYKYITGKERIYAGVVSAVMYFFQQRTEIGAPPDTALQMQIWTQQSFGYV